MVFHFLLPPDPDFSDIQQVIYKTNIANPPMDGRSAVRTLYHGFHGFVQKKTEKIQFCKNSRRETGCGTSGGLRLFDFV
jgi:hypothetical protein